MPDRASAPLKVFLLGRFEVIRGDTPIPPQAWRRRRPADLLKLVALAPGRTLARDEVVAALWPDKDPASGANNLHRALYDLRQILGGRSVDLERGHVTMVPEAWVDVDAFEEAVRSPDAGARGAALALYRGDLSPEDPESAWLAAPRARLRALATDAAIALGRAAVERADPTPIPLLRRVLDAEPAHEGLQALLIRMLAVSGRRADALRQCDACESALRARGEWPPGPELRALRDAVQRGDIGPSPGRAPYDGYRRAARRLLGTSDPAPLRGRTASLLLFESLVEQGSGSLVLLGERGVGKSRLAVEGARIAQQAGAVVLTGVFDPTRPAPYGCFAELFAEHQRAAGAAGEDPFAGRPRPGAEAETARLLEAVRASLAAIGGGRPVYLLVDDLHRADESSANLFHYLARSARELRLMLVATCREDAVHAGTPVQMLLAHLDCERLARGVRVQRLDLAAARQQLGDLLGTPPSDALAAHFYRLTDGSPFYTEELARAFKESGHLKVADDPAAAVRERVSRLGPRVVTLLEAAAVAGRHFDFEVVRPATELTAHEALGALEQVLEARIVDEDGAGYHFHHSLVREAIHSALSPERRVALHRRIADAIEAQAAAGPGGVEDVAEQLAHHRRAGDQPERAFVHLVTAGHRAAARAGLREANAFYETALALAGPAGAPGPRRLELLEALGNVQLTLAELRGALRSFHAAGELTDAEGWQPGPDARARARRGAALVCLVAGRREEARAHLEAALAEALLDPDERAELLLLLSQLAWHDGAPREALDAARRCLGEAQRVGDAPLAARASDLAVVAAAGLGEPAPADVTGAVEPGPEQAFDVHLVLWDADLLGDRTRAELEADAAAFRDRAVTRGSVAAVALSRVLQGRLAARGGHLDVAEPLLREGHALFRSGGSALGETVALDALAALLTARGRVEEAMSLLGEAAIVAERANLRRHALIRVHATLARNRLAAGAVYAAEDAVREASELAARHGECVVCHALFRPELIRVDLLRGRTPEAAAEAEDLMSFAARHRGRGLGAVASVARGRVLAAIGQNAVAAEAFSSAAEAWTALGAPFDAAYASALAARALRATAAPEHASLAGSLEARAAEVLGPGPFLDP